jgi:cell fate (sporulation/competence/biofilm development) regulator YlbF (YheA/YmcA/DUF963 family)
MNDNWILATYDLVDELKDSETVSSLRRLHKDIEDDKTIASLVEAFQRTKDAYEDAKQYGDYHPDLATRRSAFQAAKTALFEHPTVAAYKQLEQTFQRQLDDISRRLAHSISPKIKTPNDLGILPRHGR